MTPSPRWLALVFVAALAWFGGWAIHLTPHHLPHSQDEVAYVYQARIFATGRTALAPAKVPEAFDAEATCVHNGRRFGGYPPGYPVVLALFIHLGAIWLAGPIVLALTVTVLFATAWRLAGPSAAILAAACALLSRCFVFAAPLFLSEPLAMLCAALLARVVLTGSGGLFAAAALMAVRPVTGAAVLGCAFLALDNRRRIRLAAYSILWFVASAALASAVAGEPTTQLYRYWGQTFVEEYWGFRAALDETLIRMVWSTADTVPFAAPLLALWAVTRRRELWFIPAAYFALALVHMVRFTSGHWFIGARYLVPASPLLILAVAVALAPLKRLHVVATLILSVGASFLLKIDAPLHAEAMKMRRDVDPGLVIRRENITGRTLVLCHTDHYDPERPGFQADNYFMAFHYNGLEESSDILFARAVAEDRLREIYRPERIVTIEWHDGDTGPSVRLKTGQPTETRKTRR
jgi:hypothetical protein